MLDVICLCVRTSNDKLLFSLQFQQLREQLEGQIARLQQENGILRDAVERCSTTNQMENK